MKLFNYVRGLQRAKAIVDASRPPLPPEWLKTTELAKRSLCKSNTAFHGTVLSRVSDQILKEKIENRGKPFFVTHSIHQAGWYATVKRHQEKDEPVILEVSGPEERLCVHSLFNTTYYVGGLDILAVYKQNPDYIAAMENMPSFKERITRIHKMALENCR